MRSIILFTFFIFLSSNPTTSVAQDTFLLGLSACPPWKKADDPEVTRKMLNSCEKILPDFIQATGKVLGVKKDNTFFLLNNDGTYSKLESSLNDIAKKATTNDRVVIYINVHGGWIDGDYKGYRTKDQGLALYTKEEPASYFSATKNKQWMLVKTFRDMVDEIEAGEILVVFDSCESGAAVHDFQFDPNRDKDWNGKEAVIVSSYEDQFANYNSDGTLPLFTEQFTKELSNEQSKGKSLAEIFHLARFNTHMALTKDCEDSPELLKKIQNGNMNYNQVCGQMPYAYDPSGILDRIIIE